MPMPENTAPTTADTTTTVTPSIQKLNSYEPRPRTREIIDPAYPLLEANRKVIESIQRQTFQYGHSESHQLDVYYPPVVLGTESGGKGCYPVLVFLYGGGLVQGARTSAPSYLVHNNLGAFFASRGIVVVIPDYRLVPSITYPQGSEDVRDALEWVIKNIPDAQGDPRRIFVLGHSAGGIHLAGVLFNPQLFSRVSDAIRGVVLMGTPCIISPDMSKLYPVALSYYGSKRAIEAAHPVGLLQRAEERYIRMLPPVRMLVAGSEPRTIASSMRKFAQAYRDKGGCVDEFRLNGHDHLSPVLALSSGSGEEWGEEIAKWIHSLVDT